jgi:hypothetical protein
MSNTTPQPCRIIDEGELAWRMDAETNRINRLFNSGSKAGSFPSVFHSKRHRHIKDVPSSPADVSASLMNIRGLRYWSK